MELFAIKERLKDYKIISIGNPDMNIDIRMVKLLEKNQIRHHNHIIYLGKTEDLPPPDTSGAFTILCYGDSLPVSRYDKSSFRVLYIPSEPNATEIFNIIQDTLSEIQKISTGLHILVDAFFAEQGLQYLIDVAYGVFGNPLFVIDNSYKYLAVSTGMFHDNMFASEETSRGYISDEGVRFIRESQIDEKIRKQNSPVYYKNPLHGKGMISDNIKINNIEVGHIMLYELDRPFNEFDSIMLHRVSRLVSMELQKNSFFNANKGLMYSYFLADLLDNPDLNYASVKERLALLGYQMKDDHYVLTIPSRSYHNAEAKLEVIVNQLHHILEGSIYAIYQNSIVVLLSRNRETGMNSYELGKLIEFLESNKLMAGISNFFGDLKDTKRFYLQAMKSVEMAEKLQSNTPINYYSDYYIYHILEMCEQNEVLNYFIHPSMMKLLFYDKEHGTELLNTLHEFLETPGQPTQISKRLFIHKNTLLYRMEKIRAIMDCKLESGDEIMTMGLSYKIMKYLKMI